MGYIPPHTSFMYSTVFQTQVMELRARRIKRFQLKITDWQIIQMLAFKEAAVSVATSCAPDVLCGIPPL